MEVLPLSAINAYNRQYGIVELKSNQLKYGYVIDHQAHVLTDVSPDEALKGNNPTIREDKLVPWTSVINNTGYFVGDMVGADDIDYIVLRKPYVQLADKSMWEFTYTSHGRKLVRHIPTYIRYNVPILDGQIITMIPIPEREYLQGVREKRVIDIHYYEYYAYYDPKTKMNWRAMAYRNDECL